MGPNFLISSILDGLALARSKEARHALSRPCNRQVTTRFRLRLELARAGPSIRLPVACEFTGVRFCISEIVRRGGAPGEIRTPDPQIRSLVFVGAPQSRNASIRLDFFRRQSDSLRHTLSAEAPFSAAPPA